MIPAPALPPLLGVLALPVLRVAPRRPRRRLKVLRAHAGANAEHQDAQPEATNYRQQQAHR
jgi:hypothetical protein